MKRFIKITLIIMLVVIIVLGALAYLLVYGKTVVYDEYEHYRNHDYSGVYSSLAVFPEKKLEAVSSEYYYKMRDELFGAECQIYLKNVYTDEIFVEEIRRLDTVNIEYMKEKNMLFVDEENYANKAYVAIANWRDRYEYAIVFENINTIVYVYLQNINEDALKMDSIFLPQFYIGNDENVYNYGEMRDDHLSFYAFRIGDQYIDCMDMKTSHN